MKSEATQDPSCSSITLIEAILFTIKLFSLKDRFVLIWSTNLVVISTIDPYLGQSTLNLFQ